MEAIIKEVIVGVDTQKAYHNFVNKLNEWWPREYTWSQEALEEIRIEGRENGKCTEIGPYGFRCDWGRVTGIVENESISFKWQISPKREPVPNPDKASEVKVDVIKDVNSPTILRLAHYNFENHGEGADEYRKMMDSEQGWDYILGAFKKFCEES